MKVGNASWLIASGSGMTVSVFKESRLYKKQKCLIYKQENHVGALELSTVR